MRVRTIQAIVVLGILYAAGLGCGGSPDEPTPVCSIAIAPGSLAFGSDGGNGSVTVTTPANCTWTATTGASWSTVPAGANASGPGTLAYTVGANASTEVRSGKVTIGDQSHAVTQQGR